MIEDFSSNEVEFDRRFRTEDPWHYLLQLHWAEGFRCSRCGHDQFGMSSRGLYLCRHCDYQHSVTAGTIFHGTSKPLALWWLSPRKNGLNATTLQALLGFSSYQTAWSIAHAGR